MRILVVGTHPLVRQPSMSLFAHWLIQAVGPIGVADLITAPAHFLTEERKGNPAAKWLAYIDQYVLLTLRLWLTSHSYDLIIIADQGNAPSSVLVPGSKLVVMIHDTIAMRQALGQVAEAPLTKWTGKLLQKVIRLTVQRAGVLLSNPGAIPGEIERLGLGRHVFVVGCPFESDRFQPTVRSPVVEPPYLLNVAGGGWRKRKDALIPLWNEVEKRSTVKLVLAGQTDHNTREAFRTAGIRSVVFMDDVSDSTLTDLYTHCAGFISPSLEEGLCIPILEAMHFSKHIFAPDKSPSYVDFFEEAVARIDFSSPDLAADKIIRTLPLPVDLKKLHELRLWSSLGAFQDRVRTALTKAYESYQSAALEDC